MGSPAMMFPTSNNAPLPIPGGYGGNYSGLNFGSSTGQPFPVMPYAGGPSYNVGSFGTGTGLAGLNAGIVPGYSGAGKDLYNMLGKAYGKGTGAILGDLLSGQLFNPQVVAAFLNAQQPGIARGEAAITGAFGDAGARFSSAAALGLGDYESQVQLNQQQTLAQMYENAQQQELSLLTGLLPTIHQERADQGGLLNKILGGAEVAGGAALLPFSGGASAGLIGSGLKTLAGGSGGGGSASPMMFPGMPGMGGNTGTFGMGAPSYNMNMPSWLGGTSQSDQSIYDWMSQSQDMQQSMADSLIDIPGLTGQ
jgi:hypothetical protein